MRKILVLLVVFVFALSGIAYAGGSIFADKLIGDTGMGYGIDVHEQFDKVTVFGKGRFSSDTDGMTKVETDALSGGLKYAFNKSFDTKIEYLKDFSGDSATNKVDLSAAYRHGSGFGIGPSIKRNVDTNDNDYFVRVDYSW